MIQINVLFAVSECTPFAKTGGLADVAGSLPKNLCLAGCHVRVVMPKYKSIIFTDKDKFKKEKDFTIKLNNEVIKCGLESYEYQEMTYYFINHEYFNRDKIYGYPDEGARYALFSKAVLEMIGHINFKPEIIHINDWHLGLLPLFLKFKYQGNSDYKKIKTVLTIHNLQYQGSFDRRLLDYCMLDQSVFDLTNHDNLVNFLKTGIVLADCVTTVSKTYAEEIKTKTFGEGLDNVLSQKEVIGILNGLDQNDFNPKTDKLIKKNYDLNRINQKKLNKSFLQTFFSLPKKDVPVLVMVSRLATQKGLDVLMKAFDDLMNLDCQLIMLGCGQPYYEQFIHEMSKMYPQKVKISIDFNPTLARFMYAGGDFLLMPSLFEPCGLTQMIAMRYGTIPIVRQTGGLKDTVEVYNEMTQSGYGFGFQSYNEKDMLNVIKYAFEIYQNKKLFKTLRQNAMKQDFSWKVSAEIYKALYEKLLDKNT